MSKLKKLLLILWVLVLTVFNSAAIPTAEFTALAPPGAAFSAPPLTAEPGTPAEAQVESPAAPANLTVNAAVTYQTMNGVGSNIHAWSWKGGELRPALDMLVDTLGHNIFRVVHDTMEWAGTGNIRPAATLTNLRNLDPDTLFSVYEVPSMQDLWDTIGYLNSKGVPGDQIMVNFMGWTAPWMGGSGQYNIPSFITNDAQTNQDIATMIASLVYYGHHRRDISGSNQNLAFSYIAPFNEPDYNGLEGPEFYLPSQMNTIYENIVSTLTDWGDTSTWLVGPDTAGNPDILTAEYSAAVLARMRHISFHYYSVNPATPASTRGGILADWLTETSVWCEGCDNNQPPTQGEWTFGSGIGDIILGDIANGFSAVLTWEGFDAYYYHHNSYSAWGHLACTQAGSGCTTSDANARFYTIRGRAWPEAAIARAVRPGMARRELTTTLPNLTALAFYNPSLGDLSIVGHNKGLSEITINGELQNLPEISLLTLYETNATHDLQRMGDVVVAGNQFTATIPADTFFYFYSPVSPVESLRIWLPMVQN